MRDRTPEPGVTHWLDLHGDPANWSEEWDKELHRDMIERCRRRRRGRGSLALDTGERHKHRVPCWRRAPCCLVVMEPAKGGYSW